MHKVLSITVEIKERVRCMRFTRGNTDLKTMKIGSHMGEGWRRRNVDRRKFSPESDLSIGYTTGGEA